MKKFTVKGHKLEALLHAGWGQAGALEVALSTFGAHLMTGSGGFHLNKLINIFITNNRTQEYYCLNLLTGGWAKGIP